MVGINLSIRIFVHNGGPNTWTDKRAMKDEFEALGGPYLQFSLYKENKDTMEAINTICKICR